jgi:hypothetical protein
MDAPVVPDWLRKMQMAYARNHESHDERATAP